MAGSTFILGTDFALPRLIFRVQAIIREKTFRMTSKSEVLKLLLRQPAIVVKKKKKKNRPMKKNITETKVMVKYLNEKEILLSLAS